MASDSGAARAAETQDYNDNLPTMTSHVFEDIFGLMNKPAKLAESKSEKTELASKIVLAAESFRGEQLWYPKYKDVTENGNLGCAISVATALRKAGVDVGMHTSVKALVADLSKWKRYPIEEAKPGDVAVGHNTENGRNHVGIISRGGGIWNNSSRALPANIWANESIFVGLRPQWLFDGYDKRYVLRPPAR